VAVTTGGGLYRYRLYDQVEVVGRVAATPCIRFVGKGDRISDRFGEKLTEPFVAACLRELFERAGLAPAFALLAPEDAAGAPAYALFVELKTPLPPGLATDLDEALRRNFHYDYCRRLGQLGPAQVIPVQNGAATYLAVCRARGMKLGNIKPAALDKQTGWSQAFGAGDTLRKLLLEAIQSRAG